MGRRKRAISVTDGCGPTDARSSIGLVRAGPQSAEFGWSTGVKGLVNEHRASRLIGQIGASIEIAIKVFVTALRGTGHHEGNSPPLDKSSVESERRNPQAPDRR